MTSRTQKQAARAYIEANPGTPYIVALNHIKKHPISRDPQGNMQPAAERALKEEHSITLQNLDGIIENTQIHNVHIYPSALEIHPMSTSFPAVWINAKTGYATCGWAHLSEKSYWKNYSKQEMTLKEIVLAASRNPDLVFVESGYLTSTGKMNEEGDVNYIHESALYQLHSHPDEPISAWFRWKAGDIYQTIDPWIIEKLDNVQHQYQEEKLTEMIELLSARFIRFRTEAATISEAGTAVEALWFNPRTLCLTYGYAKTRSQLSNPLDLSELASQDDLTLWEEGYVYPTQGGVRAANIVPAHIYPVIQAIYGKEDVAVEGWDKWGYVLSIKTGHECEHLPQSFAAHRSVRMDLAGATLPHMRDEKNPGHVNHALSGDLLWPKRSKKSSIIPAYAFDSKIDFIDLPRPVFGEWEENIRKAYELLQERRAQAAESEKERDFDFATFVVVTEDNQPFSEDITHMLEEIIRKGRAYGVHCYVSVKPIFRSLREES